jgi:hypothetical protein
MWQDILKGAVANILIDWTELKYYGNIVINDEHSDNQSPLGDWETKLIDKLEVRYSIGISKELTTDAWAAELEGIALSFNHAKVRITIEGQTLESDVVSISYNGYDDHTLNVRPSYVTMTIDKKDGKYELRRNPRMGLESYD